MQALEDARRYGGDEAEYVRIVEARVALDGILTLLREYRRCTAQANGWRPALFAGDKLALSLDTLDAVAEYEKAPTTRCELSNRAHLRGALGWWAMPLL